MYTTIYENYTIKMTSKKPKDKLTTPKAKDTLSSSSTKGKLDSSPLADSERKRPKTAYNVFMRETMAMLKEEGLIEGKDRMKEVGRLWRELSNDEREVFKLMADQINEEELKADTESKSKKKLTDVGIKTPKTESTKKGKTTKSKTNDSEDSELEETTIS
jgi:hypothetical protein